MLVVQSGEPPAYDLYDDHGRPVGRILFPRDAIRFGRTAGTLLLRRSHPTPATPHSAAPHSRAA
jgi:hypothetical protein